VSAALVGEAVDVLFTVCRALAVWIVAAAFVATVVIYTLVLTGAWAWHAVRRRSTGSLAASQPADDPIPPRAAERHTGPQWARTNKEAA
jgi:hypothetical protein